MSEVLGRRSALNIAVEANRANPSSTSSSSSSSFPASAPSFVSHPAPTTANTSFAPVRPASPHNPAFKEARDAALNDIGKNIIRIPVVEEFIRHVYGLSLDTVRSNNGQNVVTISEARLRSYAESELENNRPTKGCPDAGAMFRDILNDIAKQLDVDGFAYGGAFHRRWDADEDDGTVPTITFAKGESDEWDLGSFVEVTKEWYDRKHCGDDIEVSLSARATVCRCTSPLINLAEFSCLCSGTLQSTEVSSWTLQGAQAQPRSTIYNSHSK